MRHALLASALLVLGCGPDSGSDVPDADNDAGTDTVEDTSSETDALIPSLDERPIIISSLVQNCPGCVEVSICGGPSQNELETLELGAYPTNDPVILHAGDRFIAFASQLPLETCHVAVGPEVDWLTDHENMTVLDAGDITLSGEMPLFDSSPMLIEYTGAMANSYTAQIRYYSEEDDYVPGADLDLGVAGGADVAAFALTTPAPAALHLVSPHVDSEGKVSNIAIDAELAVSWSGADSYDEILLQLSGDYCDSGGDSTYALCRVRNDGEFAVPIEVIQALDHYSTILLTLSASRPVAITASEITDHVTWNVNTTTHLPIFHDRSVQVPVCESTSMEGSSVGLACDADTACGGGCCHSTDRFGGGYCTLFDCENDQDCPSNAICAPSLGTGGHPYCAKRCTSNDDCRADEYYYCGPGGFREPAFY